MQTRKPGGGGGKLGAQTSPGLLHTPLWLVSQVIAWLLKLGESAGPGGGVGEVATLGVHPLSVSTRGLIVTDCTQGIPPHCSPAGIAFVSVHSPAQSMGGSNEVQVVAESLQLLEDAVMVGDSAHVPVGGVHSHARHGVGDHVKSA
jgi:hypothetical protein